MLLLGEYAVLAPGGLGVAAAIELRVRARVRSGAVDALRIEGTDGIDRFAWPGGAGGVLDAVVEACAQTLGRTPAPALVTVDSSALTAGGRKLGLGSSAAVAVAVTFALLSRGKAGAPLDAVFRTALRAHRAAQGGRGSGYDVAVATHGGIGLFHGGAEPSFEPLRAGPGELLLIQGDRPLATGAAIGRYAAWAERWPAACRDHRRRSDAIVRGALADRRWGDALLDGRRLTRRLGEAIDVPVEPPELRERLDLAAAAGHAGKPAGAGGELAVCVRAPGVAVPEHPWLRPVAVSPVGVSAR